MWLFYCQIQNSLLWWGELVTQDWKEVLRPQKFICHIPRLYFVQKSPQLQPFWSLSYTSAIKRPVKRTSSVPQERQVCYCWGICEDYLSVFYVGNGMGRMLQIQAKEKKLRVLVSLTWDKIPSWPQIWQPVWLWVWEQDSSATIPTSRNSFLDI